MYRNQGLKMEKGNISWSEFCDLLFKRFCRKKNLGCGGRIQQIAVEEQFGVLLGEI